MKVAVEARLKNGILYEAAKKLGSQTALARYLGLTPAEVGRWINFRDTAIKEQIRANARTPAFWQDIENKLFELTGHTFEEIFPPEVRSQAFLKREKRMAAIVEMPIEQLIAAGVAPQLPPAPDDLLFAKEGQQAIEYVLQYLKPRSRQVIEMRFGLGSYNNPHSLQEVGEAMGITPERVRQIENSALTRLRWKGLSKHLKPWKDR